MGVKNQLPEVFPDRFSLEYLKYLLSQLKEENLLKNAIDYPKEVITATGKRTFKKCISIDFCGLASNTLLGTYVGRGAKTNTAKIREEVTKAFLALFSRETLKRLNDKGAYLKVRFCFSYLYGDYPVCLMVAEHPRNWQHMGKKVSHDFFISKPITKEQFEASKIWRSQRDSLTTIMEIIQHNDSLVIEGSREKNINTIQVRFAVIPSPVTLLFINKIALCDSYLYSTMESDSQLSVHYPVCVLHETRNRLQFESVKRHFGYLWRHDLTLFCSDGTYFKNKRSPEGLALIRPPVNENGNINIDWEHKRKAIIQRLTTDARTEGRKYKENKKHTTDWLNNLNFKLRRNTQKMPLSSEIVEAKRKTTGNTTKLDLHVKIGMFKGNFWLCITNNDTILCEKIASRSSVLFCALLHYGNAKQASIKTKSSVMPIMHQEYFLGKRRLIGQIKKQIHRNLKKDVGVNEETIFRLLFSEDPELHLALPKERITIDWQKEDLLRKAKYTILKNGLHTPISALAY